MLANREVEERRAQVGMEKSLLDMDITLPNPGSVDTPVLGFTIPPAGGDRTLEGLGEELGGLDRVFPERMTSTPSPRMEPHQIL